MAESLKDLITKGTKREMQDNISNVQIKIIRAKTSSIGGFTVIILSWKLTLWSQIVFLRW